MTFISYKKIFSLTKGFNKKNKNCIRISVNRLTKGLAYAYKERKLKKRLMRKEWILSINAATKEHDIKYSRFIYGLNHSNLELDRKVLSEMAKYEPLSFKAVVDELKLQTGLVQETRNVDLASFGNAVNEGLVVNPGDLLPSLEEAKEKAKEIPLKWRFGHELGYQKPKKPSPQEFEKLRNLAGWESDWEDDRHWDLTN